MSDTPTPRVSVRKEAASSAVGPGKPPRTVLLAVGALVLTGVFALAGGISLNWLRSWLFDTAVQNNGVGKGHQTAAQLHHTVSKTVEGQIIASAVVLAAVLIVARAAYGGKYWTRWATIGLWVIATFTSTVAGAYSLLSVGASAPAAYKVLSFLSALMFLGAVVLVSMKPSGAYFALTRPAPAPGGARRGLFGRPAATGAGARARGPVAPRTPATTTPASANGTASANGMVAAGSSAAEGVSVAASRADRARAKQRANAEAGAGSKVPELTPARRASKSRRTPE